MKTKPTLIQRVLLLFAAKKTQIDKFEGIAIDYKKIGKTVFVIKERSILKTHDNHISTITKIHDNENKTQTNRDCSRNCGSCNCTGL